MDADHFATGHNGGGLGYYCAVIYADQRWIGNHGIGRFARHVLAGLDYRPVALTSHPAAPLDAWRLARALGKLTHTIFSFRRDTIRRSSLPHLSFSRSTISATFTAQRTAVRSFGCTTQL